jgi:23S rRNA (adenine2030-N6)-methyltransferase
MKYRHAYHAGNFADVLKHAVMTAVLARMLARSGPLSYVESHAGAGLYLLDSREARRSREAEAGILRLAGLRPHNSALALYLRIVAALPENQAGLRAYPGSPLIAAGLLGDEDRLILVEGLPGEAAALRRLFRHDRRVGVHCRDGWEALAALLPPSPRRGLLLLDPPYESPDDFRRVAAGLALARHRWRAGVLVAWYPIKDRRSLRAFYQELAGAGLGELLRAELSVYPDDNAAGLNGSGMVIVAPPGELQRDLGELLVELSGPLQLAGAPPPRVDWLTPPGSAAR